MRIWIGPGRWHLCCCGRGYGQGHGHVRGIGPWRCPQVTVGVGNHPSHLLTYLGVASMVRVDSGIGSASQFGGNHLLSVGRGDGWGDSTVWGQGGGVGVGQKGSRVNQEKVVDKNHVGEENLEEGDTI